MPSPTVKKWLFGRYVSITIQPQVPDASNVLAPPAGVAATNFVGTADRVEVRSDPRLEEISSMDATLENYVLLKDNFEVNLTEIQQFSGSNIGLLFTLYELFLCVITCGGRKWTFYGVRGPGTWNMETGKSVAQATIRSIDIGGPNPTYTAAP